MLTRQSARRQLNLLSTAVSSALLDRRHSVTAAMSQRLHSALRVRQTGALVIVQPWDGTRVAGDSLTVDLATGTSKFTEYAKLESNYFDAFGVAGLVPLLGSYAIVLITAGTQVLDQSTCCDPANAVASYACGNQDWGCIKSGLHHQWQASEHTAGGGSAARMHGLR